MKTNSQQLQANAPLRVTAALLAAWVLILSLAGVSPALHAWLHADSGCAHECGSHTDTAPENNGSDGHYCGVIALQGASAPAIAIDLPERSEYTHIHFEPVHERLQAHLPEPSLNARAPPIEILV